MFIEVRIVSPAVELESIVYEDSLGQKHQTILYFYGTMARRRHRHEALLQSITPRNENVLTKLNGSSLLNEIHLWTHNMQRHGNSVLYLQSCIYKERM